MKSVEDNVSNLVIHVNFFDEAYLAQSIEFDEKFKNSCDSFIIQDFGFGYTVL